MQILIADDDAVSRRLLQSYLQKWGHEVVVAQDGGQAWRLFEDGQFPIVISDWMMPEMDGVDLIRRIRASPRPGYVYTILLTARSQKEDLVEGMEAGADDFITKPFDRDELRVRLREGERFIRLEQERAEQQRALEAAVAQNQKLAADGQAAAALAGDLERAITGAENGLRALRQSLVDSFGSLQDRSPAQPELAGLQDSVVGQMEKALAELGRARRMARELGGPANDAESRTDL
jgi:two-component system NtrC family sensor kinase